MCSRLWQVCREQPVLFLKSGSVCLLFLLSVLIVACGAGSGAQVPGSPPVTVTINLNQTFASPTPPLPPYACGAWATQSTPAYAPNAIVDVYAKFVQNVSGNPVGMGNAHAVAYVSWPDGTASQIPTTTTSDGLAVFQIPLQPSSLNRVVLVAVVFTSADGQHACKVEEDQRAFFTPIEVSPTASPSASPTGTPTFGGTGTPSILPSVSPVPPKRTPTP